MPNPTPTRSRAALAAGRREAEATMQVSLDEKQAWRGVLEFVAGQMTEAQQARTDAATEGAPRLEKRALRGLGWHHGTLTWRTIG